MSGRSRAEIEGVFRSWDANGDGTLTKEDLRAGFQKHGHKVSENELEKIHRDMDVGQDGTVDLDDFVTFMTVSDLYSKVTKQEQKQVNTKFFSTATETAMKTLLAGGVAGAVSRTVVAPFERLKIIFQTQGTPPKYTSVLQGLRKMWQEEGVKGYFKGNGTNCVRIFPASALQFYTYETYKRLWLEKFLFAKGQQDLNPLQRLVAGGGAGITALVATYPLEFVRARLTVQRDMQYKGIWDCVVKVTRQEGIMTLYRGLWPSIVGVVPYVGIDFAAYETLKQYTPKGPDGSVSSLNTLFNGALAGTLAQTVSYPLDLVRRKMQVQGFQGANKDEMYNGMLDAFKKIWRREGIKGFYRGLAPNYLKVVPAISVSFWTFEQMKILLEIKPHAKK